MKHAYLTDTLSIIIPARNEADYIVQTIHALKERGTSYLQKQIIVVDGGSTDATRSLALKLGVEVVHEPYATPGRAFLLNKGAAKAKGDILLFCDADTIVPPDYDREILKVFELPEVVAGAFEFKLDGKKLGLRVVECINRVRYRIWKRYYGDQGIFVRHEVFDAVDGFPSLGLMEASEFCISLATKGRLKLINKPMLTSARRFIENGIYRVLWFDIRVWWLNLLGQDVEEYGREYWKDQIGEETS